MALRMSRVPKLDPDVRKALDVVDCEYGTPVAERSPRIDGVTRLGELFLFTDEERIQIRAIQELIEAYVARPHPPRPLSLAVFGPPGSGKSTAVRQILKNIEEDSDLKLPRTDLNLTQVPDANALAKVLTHAGRSADGTVPVFFFDEFDAPKDGAPYGWLSWFLAPMQDGEFVYDGEVIPLRRAVYIFAGGTAAKLEEFSKFAQLSEFQRAKGPDFISRLRGFLDVSGPNAAPRLLRRALLFRAEFKKRAGRPRAPGGDSRGRRRVVQFRPDRELMKSLLQVGQYRHGARSISAVVELSAIDERKRRFGWDGLPKDHLLGLHIDRGPLDAKLIGGTVAFSGYSKSAKSDVARLWRAVAHRLWDEGATLSYAGRWAGGDASWLIEFLQKELSKRPPEPSASALRRGNPRPWLESILDDTKEERASVNKAIPLDERNHIGLHVRFAPLLTKEERRLEEGLRQRLNQFRRRLAISEGSVAMFVVEGFTKWYGGRFPGIPEEVMLSLAQAKPIYVAGAFGGAAAQVGSVLGLTHARRGEVPALLRRGTDEDSRSPIEDKFRPAPWTDLPVTAAELTSFFKSCALGGPKWPDNGLTFEDNRRLFASKDLDEIADLVATGLQRRFGKNKPAWAESHAEKAR